MPPLLQCFLSPLVWFPNPGLFQCGRRFWFQFVQGVSPLFTDSLPPSKFNFMVFGRLALASGGMGWLYRVGVVWFPSIPLGLVSFLTVPSLVWFGLGGHLAPGGAGYSSLGLWALGGCTSLVEFGFGSLLSLLVWFHFCGL